MTAPKEHVSSDGFKILVGKNNRQNDMITFKLAEKSDIWCHVKSYPGSHVLIKTGGVAVPDTTLEEACILAATHSKAANLPLVPVDYTMIKFVKKPPGAKPGMVTYDSFKTAHVEPNMNELKK